MFLKRLEIVGFKSFAERIGIDFVPGVTAIVGPNGSGKSNISDAIKWVLGEQSAKTLRGAKMEDVIFSGSDSRKSLNYAEVTLILDNSRELFPLDYTEISVSRRVFRSGESVYLLNGQQCRLKDINDVFLDSGLGKEAFSIISQGRVDEILNSRPEDRRSILDEAAGVLKYRKRKQKAEYKLVETSDNLDRVLDILKELETRIEPLRLQSEAAKRHSQLSERIEELDVTLLNIAGQRLQRKITSMKELVFKFQKVRAERETEVQIYEQSSAKLKEKLSMLDRQVEKLQESLVEVSMDIEKWDGRRLLTAEKQRNTGFQIERIQTELMNVEEKQDSLKGKLTTTRQHLIELNLTFETYSKEIEDINKILERSVVETEGKLEELKANYIDQLNEEATLRNELKHIEERLNGEKSSTEKIIEQKWMLNKQLETLLDEKYEKEQGLAEQQVKQQEQNNHYMRWQKELKEKEQALQSKQQLLQQAYNKQHEMQGRIRVLKSMEADFSGFYTGVKEVLKAEKTGVLRGIHGAIAELIQVDSGYVKAIETALSGSLQHIITSSEADARQAITYLRNKSAGRATFLPLDVIKPRMIQPSQLQKVMNHPEFVHTANELVAMSPQHQNIKDNLLGHVVVARTLAAASEIAKALSYRYRVVTIEGDVVNAGGSLTGGGTRSQTSVFTRKAELELLTSQLDQMNASIEAAKKTVSDAKVEISRLMHNKEQSRQLSEKIQVEITETEARIREILHTIKSTETEVTSVKIGERSAQDAKVKLLAQKQELFEQHSKVKKSLKEINDEITTLERYTHDRRSEEASLTSRLAELREKTAVLREQRNTHTEAIQSMEEEIRTLYRKIEVLQEEMDYFAEEDNGEDFTEEEIAEQLQLAKKKKRQLEAEILKAREKRIEKVAALSKQENALKQLRETVSELNTKQNERAVDLSRFEVKHEAIEQKLLQSYGLRLSSINSAEITEIDEKAMQEELIHLKKEVTSIGPVNPSSISEYEEITERYNFLTMQREDLLEAKSTLKDAMSEMDDEMTARFSTTFSAVQKQFRRVFKEMFGGGDADLILTDKSNLLETGIDIVARPPGKKFQSLSLLSGGERALTAISLLFSIIEVRPVPFCILDEVEAALDEANVTRYSKYLRAFSEKTQFIVITHRKGTMEGADVLYGITMQESGVSKLISVKLSEIPEGAIS